MAHTHFKLPITKLQIRLMQWRIPTFSLMVIFIGYTLQTVFFVKIFIFISYFV